MNNHRIEFGRRLKAYREKRGLTQPELAKAAGVHAVTVAKWEGGVQEPSASKLLTLAATLRVSPNVLMGQPKASTRKALADYLASPYHAVRVEQGKPASHEEQEHLEYLLDSRWAEGTHTPRAIDGLLQLTRDNPELFEPAPAAPPAPADGEPKN